MMKTFVVNKSEEFFEKALNEKISEIENNNFKIEDIKFNTTVNSIAYSERVQMTALIIAIEQ